MSTTLITTTPQLPEEEKQDEERMGTTPITFLSLDPSRRSAFQWSRHFLRPGESPSAERKERQTESPTPPSLEVCLFLGETQVAAEKAAAKTARAMARTQTAQRSVAAIAASSAAALAIPPPASSDNSASFSSISPAAGGNSDDEDNALWAPYLLSSLPVSEACYSSSSLAQAQSQANALHSGINGSICSPPPASTSLNNNTDASLMSSATASVLSFFSSRSTAVSSNAKEQKTLQESKNGELFNKKNESPSLPSPILVPEPCQCTIL